MGILIFDDIKIKTNIVNILKIKEIINKYDYYIEEINENEINIGCNGKLNSIDLDNFEEIIETIKLTNDIIITRSYILREAPDNETIYIFSKKDNISNEIEYKSEDISYNNYSNLITYTISDNKTVIITNLENTKIIDEYIKINYNLIINDLNILFVKFGKLDKLNNLNDIKNIVKTLNDLAVYSNKKFEKEYTNSFLDSSDEDDIELDSYNYKVEYFNKFMWEVNLRPLNKKIWVTKCLYNELNEISDINEVFVISCINYPLHYIQYLYSLYKIDINYENDKAFRYSCKTGNLELVKWLYSLGNINIHANNNEAIKNSALSFEKYNMSIYKGQIIHKGIVKIGNNIELIKWLYSLGNIDLNLEEFKLIKILIEKDSDIISKISHRRRNKINTI